MSLAVTDRFAAARAVADAVLYEGYVLYPYRASSQKNQVRWQFGVLTPRAFSEADGSERWTSRTECLVEPGSDPVLAVRIRCLQVQHRAVEAVRYSGPGESGGDFAPVDSLEVDGQVYVEWDEAIDQIVDVSPLRLLPLEAGYEEAFAFESGTDVELIQSADGPVAGRIVRRREPVEGLVRIHATRSGGQARLVKVTVTVENTTPWSGAGTRRDDVIGHSLVAVHTMLAVEGGTFVSLLDPPDAARDAVAGCHSEGSFPVLIGAGDVMLSSPIILYDHPEVAPESPGDLYDATEIDEILALRVLTLTDEEKSEARATDPRAAAIIDRCDDMPPEMWERLHGAVRSLRSTADAEHGPGKSTEVVPSSEPGFEAYGETPAEAVRPWDPEVEGFAGTSAEAVRPWDPEVEGFAGTSAETVQWWEPEVDASVDPWTDSVVIAGVEVAKGTAVRLRPSHRADAQDLFLNGLTATVAGVFKDVDGSEHVAVTVDDDPATDELLWQGRYLFFFPDEVEPLPMKDEAR